MRQVARCGVAGLALAALASAAGANDELDREAWRARFRAAREAVVAAREERDAALEAYQNTRHRRRVRGTDKQQIIDKLEEAEAAVPEAEAALQELYKEARAAGVPPAWMRIDSRPARRRSD